MRDDFWEAIEVSPFSVYFLSHKTAKRMGIHLPISTIHCSNGDLTMMQPLSWLFPAFSSVLPFRMADKISGEMKLDTNQLLHFWRLCQYIYIGRSGSILKGWRFLKSCIKFCDSNIAWNNLSLEKTEEFLRRPVTKQHMFDLNLSVILNQKNDPLLKRASAFISEVMLYLIINHYKCQNRIDLALV